LQKIPYILDNIIIVKDKILDRAVREIIRIIDAQKHEEEYVI